MAAQGGLISASDFTTLKNLVKNEINRRSNSKSVGSMSAYNGSSYNYTTTPAKGGNINLEHIQKITKPLDAVTGNNTTPGTHATITAAQIINATNTVKNLSGKSTTANNSSNAGCKSSCSGLCYTGCYSSCSGCSGSCSGSCSGGCNNTCNNTCSGGCKTSCNNTCSGSCSGGCSGCSGCGSGCGSGCSGGCSSCTDACSGCGDGCWAGCRNGCGNCDGGCAFSCTGGDLW